MNSGGIRERPARGQLFGGKYRNTARTQEVQRETTGYVISYILSGDGGIAGTPGN